MRYMGSKARIASSIIPLLMEGHDDGKPYVEPFVGGGNVIHLVPATLRIGADHDPLVIALLRAVASGWQPPTRVTEEEYADLRARPDRHPPELVAFAAFCCSYGGKKWGGYWRSNRSDGTPRNPAEEQARNLLKQAPGLASVALVNCDYSAVPIPDHSTVYCDPPYAGTTGYTHGFSHEVFWNWARLKARTCRVFVSEYTCPPGAADPIWSQPLASSLTKNTGAKVGQETLFRVRPLTVRNRRSLP